MIGFLIAAHVGMAWLCAYLHTRKAKRAGINDRFAWDRFGIALIGGWLIVPEMWDTGWMDKYIEEPDGG